MRIGMKRGRAALAILLAALSAGAFPQATELSTLDEIAAKGKEASVDYAKALLAADKAASEVPDLVKLRSSALSATYSYSGAQSGASGPSAAAEPASDISASLNVPIVDQASLSASVKDDGSGKVSASVKPLEHSDSRAQKEIAYEKALAAAAEAERGAGDAAVKAALKWMAAERSLATKERAAAYAEEAYAAAKAAREIASDEFSLDDVSKALTAWSKARSELISQEASARSAKADLLYLVGAAGGGVSVKALGDEELEAALAALKERLSGAEAAGTAESYSALSAALDLRSASSTLKSTWPFDPELSISAGFSFAKDVDPVPSLSVGLTLSLDDFKGDEVERAKSQVELAARTLARAKSQEESAYAQAVAKVGTAALSTESQRIAVAQAAEIRAEAAFLYAQGSYSELEDESAALSSAQAEDALYQALADEYAAWLDLAALAKK